MLPDDLRDAVLERLGADREPRPDVAGLASLYACWCRAVPFDNLRKLIALRAAADGPLPGLEPADFFTAFLAHGTGGTCWPTSEAWLALLRSCGFDARRAAATMLSVSIPEGSPHRPNHGSTIVTIDGLELVVDTSMLSEEPLVLGHGATAVTSDPVVGIEAENEAENAGQNDGESGGGRWVLRFMPWRPTGRLACELDLAAVPDTVPAERYEYSRAFSPFNVGVHARRNFADHVTVLALGSVFRIDRPSGTASAEPLDGNTRRRDEVLVGEMGYSEEIVAALPADTVTA